MRLGYQTENQIEDAVLCADQGDIRIQKVERIPAEYVMTKNNVVCPSANKNHHVVDLNEVDVYAKPGTDRKVYVRLKGASATVTHLRSEHGHKPIRVNGGVDSVYRILRQVDFWEGLSRLRAD